MMAVSGATSSPTISISSSTLDLNTEDRAAPETTHMPGHSPEYDANANAATEWPTWLEKATFGLLCYDIISFALLVIVFVNGRALGLWGPPLRHNLNRHARIIRERPGFDSQDDARNRRRPAGHARPTQVWWLLESDEQQPNGGAQDSSDERDFVRRGRGNNGRGRGVHVDERQRILAAREAAVFD
jgi:hypothetical protein